MLYLLSASQLLPSITDMLQNSWASQYPEHRRIDWVASYPKDLHQDHLVRVFEVDLVAGVNEIGDLAYDFTRVKRVVLAYVVPNGILG